MAIAVILLELREQQISCERASRDKSHSTHAFKSVYCAVSESTVPAGRRNRWPEIKACFAVSIKDNSPGKGKRVKERSVAASSFYCCSVNLPGEVSNIYDTYPTCGALRRSTLTFPQFRSMMTSNVCFTASHQSHLVSKPFPSLCGKNENYTGSKKNNIQFLI